MPSSAFNQLPWVLLVFALFSVYGGLVRQGRLRNQAVLWAGAFVAMTAVIAAGAPVWGMYQRNLVSLPVLLLNPLIMAGVSAWAVNVAYRSQQITDIATFTIGDTKILIWVCQPARVPDVDALILPVDTNLQSSDSCTVPFLRVVGLTVTRALRKAAPVKMGQVLSTSGGDLAPAKLIFVSVADYPQPVTVERLRKGIDHATQQARKSRAESLAVPVGALRGLPAPAAIAEVAAGILKQHKAFAEIVFIAPNARLGRIAAEEVAKQTETTVMVK